METVARTDRDMPYRLREEDGSWAVMLRGPGFRLNYVRPRSKSARQKAKAALRQGTEPGPSRHRHSALWDRWQACATS